MQIPATIEEAVDHLNALAEWQEQVDKLSTPKLTRGVAEVLTEAIRRGLADADQLCNELLAGGVPRANVTTLLLEAWARFREEFTDAEITDGMWTYMIAPRVEVIANWQQPTMAVRHDQLQRRRNRHGRAGNPSSRPTQQRTHPSPAAG